MNVIQFSLFFFFFPFLSCWLAGFPALWLVCCIDEMGKLKHAKGAGYNVTLVKMLETACMIDRSYDWSRRGFGL